MVHDNQRSIPWNNGCHPPRLIRVASELIGNKAEIFSWIAGSDSEPEVRKHCIPEFSHQGRRRVSDTCNSRIFYFALISATNHPPNPRNDQWISVPFPHCLRLGTHGIFENSPVFEEKYFKKSSRWSQKSERLETRLRRIRGELSVDPPIASLETKVCLFLMTEKERLDEEIGIPLPF